MDPVWVLFWSVLIMFAGFFVGWLVPGHAQERWRQTYKQWQELKLNISEGSSWRLEGPGHEYMRDVVFGFAVLAGILGTGWLCGMLLGNPWLPRTAFTFAFAAGLAWGAWQWMPAQVRILLREGNHWHPPNETWSDRLARWGFPTSEQMRMAEFREDLRRRLERSVERAAVPQRMPHPW